MILHVNLVARVNMDGQHKASACGLDYISSRTTDQALVTASLKPARVPKEESINYVQNPQSQDCVNDELQLLTHRTIIDCGEKTQHMPRDSNDTSPGLTEALAQGWAIRLWPMGWQFRHHQDIESQPFALVM